jgi:opacity protein-like surface antigen
LIRTNTLLLAAALLVTASGAGAQQTTPPTFLQRQLSRIDFGINAAALINKTVSGNVDPKNGAVAPNQGEPLSDDASNTVGALVSLRYVKTPLVGAEFNFLYSRLTENYCCSVPINGQTGINFGLQTQADEFSLGYLVTPKIDLFGFQPFASAGIGTTEFKPTKGGGQGERVQARMNYYYSVGIQKDLFSNFGVRAGFRQTFFLAPDYGDNYFSIYQHTTAYEPNFGFYLRF